MLKLRNLIVAYFEFDGSNMFQGNKRLEMLCNVKKATTWWNILHQLG